MADATPPRIYYVHPLMAGSLAGWGLVLDAAAGMGFDTVCVAPIFATGPTKNLFLPADWERALPELGEDSPEAVIGHIAAEARQRGLAVLMDLAADRVAVGSALAEAFDLDGPAPSALDPRVAPEDRGSIVLPADQAAAVTERLAPVLGRLVAAGLSGFRCVRLESTPPQLWRGLIDAVRRQSPACRFLAWTPGLAAERLAALAGAGFDAAFSSVRWWDCRAGWLVDERERQRPFGPALAFPEAPFERRLAARPDTQEILARRSTRGLWLAASLGDGLLVPMGFEFGAREPMPVSGNPVETYADLKRRPIVDVSAEIAQVNAFLARDAGRLARGDLRLVVGGAASVSAVLRADAEDVRRARTARLILVNPALDRSASLSAAALAAEAGQFLPFRDVLRSEPNLGPESRVSLRPGEVRILEGSTSAAILLPHGPDAHPSEAAVKAPRLVVESVTPVVDGGRYPVKRTIGEVLHVEADAYGEGHDLIAVAVRWRPLDQAAWRERRMRALGNDRWQADIPLDRLGRHVYVVEAWRDAFAIFRYELDKKHEAGLAVPLELEEGRLLIERRLAETGEEPRLRAIADRLARADDAGRLAILMAPETRDAMTETDPKPFLTGSAEIPVDAERVEAGFASWYEMFPRSQSGDPTRHGTFDDVITRLPYVRSMGFDVLYFPPIHPIGRTNRKGRNNTLTPAPEDPGSPYAIGSDAGGHEAIHPELGDFESFGRLVKAAAEHGLELALDLAINASPDHPWIKQHPEWFDWRPDGTIRYAENPPKKYEDIVNVDYYAEGATPSLWVELRDIVLMWVSQGVKLFRVDNPHTKPFPFWEWLIAEVRAQYPDVVFLSEAFTRPKVMYNLAKIGFSQSYTYFTWRNTKWEMREYLTELSTTAPQDFFRPHFFVNTHDINPDFLQNAPRPAFLIRAALATMLSGLWGMYNGFELCEGRPDAKKKEYANSEKYELTAWDWDRPGNIIAEISRLNRIRRDNPALHSHLGIIFHTAQNENVLYFEKATASRDNVLLIAISLDPVNVQEADIEVPVWEWSLPDNGALAAEDLMRGHQFLWNGKHQRIRLDPAELPFSIWRVRAA